MKTVTKIACILLSLCIMLSFAGCSAVNTTPVFTYEDTSITSDYYSLVLSYEKGFYVYLFSYYYGIDLSTQTSYWDEEFTEGVTLADSVTNDINSYCKMILICNYLCNKYNIEVPEDQITEIEENIADVIEDYGGDDMFVVELAKLGCNKETFRKFMYDTAKTELLVDYLYGENGIQKVAATAVEEEFFKSYKKVDSMSFSFFKYDDDGNASAWLGDYTDNEITAYFLDNYKTVDYLYYEKGTNESDDDFTARVTEVLDSIKNGSKTFDDVKGDADTKYSNWTVTYGDTDDKLLEIIDGLSVYAQDSEEETEEDTSEKADIKDCTALYQDSKGAHIVIRKATEATMMDDDIKADCIECMSAEYIQEFANNYLESVKNGDTEYGVELDTEFYSAYVSDNIFTDSDFDSSFLDKYNGVEAGGYFIYTTDSGIFVCRRSELTSDDLYSSYEDYYGNKTVYYDEIESSLSNTAFYEYLETYYDSVIINEDELGRYNILTALEFGNW